MRYYFIDYVDADSNKYSVDFNSGGTITTTNDKANKDFYEKAIKENGGRLFNYAFRDIENYIIKKGFTIIKKEERLNSTNPNILL